MVACPCRLTFAPNHFAYHADASPALGTFISISSVAMAVVIDGSSLICTFTFSGDIRKACRAVAPGSGLMPAASHFASESFRLLTLKPMADTVEPSLGCGGPAGA